MRPDMPMRSLASGEEFQSGEPANSLSRQSPEFPDYGSLRLYSRSLNDPENPGHFHPRLHLRWYANAWRHGNCFQLLNGSYSRYPGRSDYANRTLNQAQPPPRLPAAAGRDIAVSG